MGNAINRLLMLSMVGALINLTGCNSDSVQSLPEPEPAITYTHMRMEQVIFNHFDKNDDGLYAATNVGVMKLEDDQWVNLTESEHWEVFDVEDVGVGHMLASVCQFPDEDTSRDCSASGGTFHLVESLDSGVTWEYVDSDFGHEEDGGGIIIISSIALEEKMFNMEYDHEIGILYATGHTVLAISEDYGRTWVKLHGEWQGLAKGYAALTIDFNNFKIWFGGQNSIEQSQLLSYDILLQETTSHTSMTDMLNEPGTVKNIRFHPNDPQTIFAAGEPGIITSTDGGETWKEFYLNDESRFYFGLLIDPVNTEKMFTSGWNKAFNDPQPFFLERTIDSGQTWEKIEYKEEADIFGGVWSMYAEYGENESTLYFGLYKGGVMKVVVPN